MICICNHERATHKAPDNDPYWDGCEVKFCRCRKFKERPEKTPEVIEAEAVLRKFYGETVRPVSQYCSALYTYLDIYRDERSEDAMTEAVGTPDGDYYYHPRPYRKVKERDAAGIAAIELVVREIEKSCLLLRLIYDGEGLRSEPCPVHKGHWSGCAWKDPGCFSDEYPQGCMSGSNVTGWLPLAETNEQYKIYHAEYPAKQAAKLRLRASIMREIADRGFEQPDAGRLGNTGLYLVWTDVDGGTYKAPDDPLADAEKYEREAADVEAGRV